MPTRSMLRIGGRTVDPQTAAGWTRTYFDEAGNTAAACAKGGKPFAYPAYDRMETGSGPDALNDADLLAPLLLNAAPSIAAVFSLRAVRPVLADALAAVPVGLSLQDAVSDGRHRALLKGLVAVLDQPGGVRGVGLTTLTKILHRKRPLFVPLFDRRVKACYWNRQSVPGYPMHKLDGQSTAAFYTELAEHIVHDIGSQADSWTALAAEAPGGVPLLRVFDVVAWNCGKDGQP